MNNEVVSYRRERARESIEEARLLLANNKLFATVNRIYYACFYEVVALLLKDGLSSPKHTGVKSLFNLHYIQTGKIAADYGRYYSRMFDHRQKGDYADMIKFNRDDVEAWLAIAQSFVLDLESHFNDQA